MNDDRSPNPSNTSNQDSTFNQSSQSEDRSFPHNQDEPTHSYSVLHSVEYLSSPVIKLIDTVSLNDKLHHFSVDSLLPPIAAIAPCHFELRRVVQQDLSISIECETVGVLLPFGHQALLTVDCTSSPSTDGGPKLTNTRFFIEITGRLEDKPLAAFLEGIQSEVVLAEILSGGAEVCCTADLSKGEIHEPMVIRLTFPNGEPFVFPARLINNQSEVQNISLCVAFLCGNLTDADPTIVSTLRCVAEELYTRSINSPKRDLAAERKDW